MEEIIKRLSQSSKLGIIGMSISTDLYEVPIRYYLGHPDDTFKEGIIDINKIEDRINLKIWTSLSPACDLILNFNENEIEGLKYFIVAFFREYVEDVDVDKLKSILFK